ncbi:hypothetical protein ACFWIY_25805 [Streptomyces sioyaensis]|uniref:hypothetical protein n=1 Tax=Streptomyces sioyaensis TaxID=67364 RepID=UPI0036534664
MSIGRESEIRDAAGQREVATLLAPVEIQYAHSAAPTGDSDQSHARRKGDRFPCEALRPQWGALKGLGGCRGG